ncbi:hypothetical protein [Pontibacter akesuensis]|uniref:Uncharacterized protein n=1 Tax=Pontibacter akesuensis TaxID=388950 RepID=A0A1I7FL29_9BACT|nr:hypothetical protein [Pontibacter akesuensis]GHA61672.1 hypothetical protein GCM10007389_12730 [Pontibacter akesuensis]SFU36848.1 hypothetical protein SAMN04487941_0286 [Pontibacter akesuensis]
MSNTAPTYSDSRFWALQKRYESFALQQVRTSLEEVGHKGLAFYLQLLSIGALRKSFEKTPRLQEIITVFEGAFSINRRSAPSAGIAKAREVSLSGMLKLAALHADGTIANLERVSEEAFRYWLRWVQRLESQTAAGTAEGDSAVAKFLIVYHTLTSQVRRLEPAFTQEQIQLEAAKIDNVEPGLRDFNAVEAIGIRLFPELFQSALNETAQREKEDTRETESLHVPLDVTALGLNKFEWLGTQKELAEMHIELKRKGWIKEIEHRTISAAYTKGDTIRQLVKPSRGFVYPDVYTTAYRPKFDGIKQRPGSSKRK